MNFRLFLLRNLRLKVTFFFLLGWFSVSAQTAISISGAVTDAKTNLPVQDAYVLIKGLNKGTTTDEDGVFAFYNLAPGKYTVIVSFVGYKTLEKKIEAQGNIKVEIKISPDEQYLNEVEVIGLSEEQLAAKKVKENVMPVTVLTAKQIENRASNLNELLARQTGVQIRRTGGLGSETRISVRGLEGRRVQVFIDGKPLNTPDGSLGINDLPLQIIERIEIYKGTIPAWLGGDGLGSAVNVVIRHRDVSYIDATATYQSFNTVNTGLILKKTFDDKGIEAGVGIFTNSSDNNFVMHSPFQEGLKIKRDHDRFKSLLTGGAVRFHHLWFDEIEIEGAYIDIHKQVQGIQRNIQHIESNGKTGVLALGLVKTNLLNNKLDFRYHSTFVKINVQFVDTSSYSYDWDGNRFPSIYGRGELGIGPNLSTTRQDEFRHQVNFNYAINPALTLNLNNTFRRGFFDPEDDLGNEYAGKNLFNYPGSLTNSTTGLTLESRLMNNRLMFSTAIKHYYNFVTGYNTNIYLQAPPDEVANKVNTPGYNIGGRYNLSEDLMIKASHERAVRLPVNAELFGDGGLITPAIFLRPEIADNHTAGLVYDKFISRNRRLQIEGNVFYMKVDKLIQLAGNGLTLGHVNYAKVDIAGADAEVKMDLTRELYFNANVTWQRLRDINRYLPGTQNVDNPTYKLNIPNVPEFFLNWSLEYHKDNLLGKNSRSRLIYEGSFVNEYNYSFAISRHDNFVIPSYLSHNIAMEQTFVDGRYIVSAEANNLTDEIIINNWNQPLPGRTFRIKLRYLLLGKHNPEHKH